MNLDDFKKQNPFEVPDGYFEQLPGKVQHKITAQTHKRWRERTLPVVRWALPVAAALALVWWVGVPMWQAENTLPTEQLAMEELDALDALPAEEVEAYLLSTSADWLLALEDEERQEAEAYEAYAELAYQEGLLELELDLIDLQMYLP